jgi:hypothetical protein
MVEYVSQGLHDAAKEAAVLLYSPGTDTFREDMTSNIDRIFYFEEGPRGYHVKITMLYASREEPNHLEARRVFYELHVNDTLFNDKSVLRLANKYRHNRGVYNYVSNATNV